MKFAKWVFTIAGIYGLIVLLPMYFLEDRMAPPGQTMTNPEAYYGFIGCAVAFQLAFLLIGRDPVRYRPIMLPSIVEKASFAAAVWPLFLMGRVTTTVTALATVDGVLAVLFAVSYLRTKPAAA